MTEAFAQAFMLLFYHRRCTVEVGSLVIWLVFAESIQSWYRCVHNIYMCMCYPC